QGTADDEAPSRRRAHRAAHRRDADLLQLPVRTLAQAENEQPDGAAVARGAAPNESRWRIPGWAIGFDARGGKAAARVSDELGHQEVHEHEADRGDGQAGHLLGSVTRGPRLPPNRKCERFLTLPEIEAQS